MLKIQNKYIPLKKNITDTLNSIYGVGISSSMKLARHLGYRWDTKSKYLDDYSIHTLNTLINRRFLIESNLRRFNDVQINNLIESKSYKGRRHELCLSVRGQRTRSNCKTQKCKRK